MDNLTSLLNEAEQFLKGIVNDALAHHDAEKPIPVQESVNDLMDLDELIAYLPGKKAKSTIYRMTSKGEIPFYKMGGLAFKRSEIDAWLSMKRIPTNEEISLIPISRKN